MPKVTIYSTTTCPYCHMEKEYLKSKNIAYEEVLLDQNPERAADSVHLCQSMGVPCTHIVQDDGIEQSILGFDKVRIDAALGIA